MAFVLTDLALIGHANGHKHWAHRTADTKATVVASGYFNAAVTQLDPGDLIDNRSSLGGTETAQILRVTSAVGVVPVTVAATDLT